MDLKMPRHCLTLGKGKSLALSSFLCSASSCLIWRFASERLDPRKNWKNPLISNFCSCRWLGARKFRFLGGGHARPQIFRWQVRVPTLMAICRFLDTSQGCGENSI